MKDLSKMSLEDVLGLNELYNKLEKIQEEDLQKLSQMESLGSQSLSSMEKMVEELKKSQSVTRKVKGAQLKKKKVHWKTAQRKRREYYQSTAKHRRIIKKGELLSTGAEGWWEHIRGHWYQKGYAVELTKEEWTEIIWPALGGRIPVFRRYNTNAPISLENIYIVESGTQKTVLFDGKEHKMRELGLIL